MPHRAIAILSLMSAAALARTEDREVAAFDAVSVASGIRATVEIGPSRPVRVEADDEVLSLVETRVEDGTLRVGFKPHTGWSGERKVSVTVQTPRLRAIAAAGGSFVRATFAREARTSLDASGGSELHIRGIDAEQLSVQGSGGSVLGIEGRAGALDLQLSGGTRLLARDLATRDVTVQASGGSQGEVRADGRIRGSLSGGSELHVRGGATAAVATSGGSSVEVGK